MRGRGCVGGVNGVCVLFVCFGRLRSSQWPHVYTNIHCNPGILSSLQPANLRLRRLVFSSSGGGDGEKATAEATRHPRYYARGCDLYLEPHARNDVTPN